MNPTYPVLAPRAFARDLITTQDLDPVYSALWGARRVLPAMTRDRLLVAYFCLYHLGAAAKLAEESKNDEWFCAKLQDAAANAGNVWPRGSERRHWRGQQAVASAEDVMRNVEEAAGVTHFLDYLAAPGTFQGVTKRVREVRGFGPWIAFKVADVLERVRGNPVDFSDCPLGFYEEPRMGVAYLKAAGVPVDGELMPDEFMAEVERWTAFVAKFSAPPRPGRACGLQEVETVACKYKSHVRGHYPLGKDTREVLRGLEGWGDLAQELRRHVAKLPHAKGVAS